MFSVLFFVSAYMVYGIISLAHREQDTFERLEETMCDPDIFAEYMEQAHVVEFAILGGVIALNVLVWMSGWAHRRSRRGHIRIWRRWLMYVLTILACAAASFADQYHKLYVPGRHFDKLDLFLDASGYIMAVTCVFIAWSIGSFVYRLIFQNKFEKKWLTRHRPLGYINPRDGPVAQLVRASG